MNPAAAVFLYLPVPYWAAFVLLSYRHDLSRLVHPVRDDGSLNNWWFVFNHLGLLDAGTPRPSKRKETLQQVIYVSISGVVSLSWALRAFPPVWYYLVIVQGVSGIVLTAATMQFLGTPPRRPYVDVLRYPRLGSRIRHMPKVSPPEQKAGQMADPRKKVRFFSVSLRNGIVMSTPSYPEKQSFIAHLIRALEASNPDFAWIQFLFVRSDYGADLVRLKNSIHATKVTIEQPSLDLVSGQEHDRRELHRDYYRQSDSRMKKVDCIIAKPAITLAIQGMWVHAEPGSINALPFDHCVDEHDHLAVFQYRDPRMLIELIDRRMVEDISKYLDRFTKSRLEPPSFIVTPEELQSYIHLPAGETAESLGSLVGGTSKRGFVQGSVAGEEKSSGRGDDLSSRVVRIAKVPENEKLLDEASVQPLVHLATSTVRTFELVYSGGVTEALLSAETVEDIKAYAGLLSLVYGGMKLEKAERQPAFLQGLLVSTTD
jgi:hypothetical protein